jgi:ferric-dicitrate binding protein FerR (iron transport regulator)
MNTKELLEKWLNNEATPLDMEALNAWPYFELYKKIDRHTKDIEVPTHDIISGLKDVKKDPSFRSTATRKKPRLISLPTLFKIAAIFVLFAVSSVFVTAIPTNIQVPMASIETIDLPDSSKVTLQENASIRYKKYGWPFTREVTLAGEAYFEVAKGKTFTVLTSTGTVQVLGTKFNVSTKKNMLIVSCYEGLVAVTTKGTTTEVTPGDSFTFGNATTNNKVYTTKPSWINNESSFVDVSFDTVLMEIENQYKVTIKTNNIDVDLRYTGSFTHRNIDEALRTITLPLNLSFSKDSKNDIQIYKLKKQ